MAGIKEITLEQKEEWNQVLNQFPQHDAYYTPGYVKGFELNGDGQPILLYYNGKNLKGMLVVMKRPVPVVQRETPEDALLEEYYDYATPYGYGGWLLQGDQSDAEKEALVHAYRDYCRDHRIVAEFDRFHPVLRNAHELEMLYEVRELGHTVCMDISSPEIIWANLSSKNRNLIRKAEKNGVQIYWGREPALFEKFEEIYNGTMDKVGATDYYYFDREYYQSILQDMKNEALIFYAVREGETIAMSIIFYGNGQLHYHLSASKREAQCYAPTNLLLYEAALFGYRIGMKTFHLGGGLGSHEDALYHFKKQFNRGEDTSFAIGSAIYNEEIYARLRELNNHSKETGFVPAYRDID